MITVEYIWLDGSVDMPQIRTKTRIFSKGDQQAPLPGLVTLTSSPGATLPSWSFDGGSTGQGTTKDSDRRLKPVRLYKNPFSEGNFLALCEVMNADGTPHESNTRSLLDDYLGNNGMTGRKLFEGTLFGFEQEYTFVDPMMQPLVPEDVKQGDFYCGVGAGKVIGRLIVEEHIKNCHEAGITLFGANAEVMISQWEFQTNPEGALKASDDLWVARYLLERGCEKFNMRVSYHPKIYASLNGAGCHVNMSTLESRDPAAGIKVLTEKIIPKLKTKHTEHINVYGVGNDLRLTGEQETSSYDEFTWGVGDRSASVRIPAQVNEQGHGYLEDRRPAATCDPYLVTSVLLETIS